jgi:hypothetical protein
VGVLETETGCVPLALSQELLAQFERWNHRRVTVSGSSFAQSDAKDVTWFMVNDRKVAVACQESPIVIYVTEIQ